MSPDPEGPRCANRLFEWTMAFAMLGFGAHVFFVPAVMPTSRYSGVLLILTTSQFTAACLAVSLIRIVALSKNGGWPIFGAQLRSWASLFAAAIWAQLAVALAQSVTGPSPGMWVYFALTGAELRSVWRARRDANGPRY